MYIYIYTNVPSISPTISWIPTISWKSRVPTISNAWRLGMNDQGWFCCARDSEKTRRRCLEPMAATSVVASSRAQGPCQVPGHRSKLIVEKHTSFISIITYWYTIIHYENSRNTYFYSHYYAHSICLNLLTLQVKWTNPNSSQFFDERPWPTPCLSAVTALRIKRHDLQRVGSEPSGAISLAMSYDVRHGTSWYWYTIIYECMKCTLYCMIYGRSCMCRYV